MLEILKNRVVPTGNILVVKGSKGPIECLSIADYGKENNIKADFLGLTKNLKKVVAKPMSLEEKWVITISSQYGCSMGCNFCDVPKVGKGTNASIDDIVGQFESCLNLHRDIKTNRLNLHIARMGEPSFNVNNILSAIFTCNDIAKSYLKEGGVFHPVISTMMPHATFVEKLVWEWLYLKNKYFNGEAGLQISVNTTNELKRELMFGGNARNLENISYIFRNTIRDLGGVRGRKITLNFALNVDYQGKVIDANYLRKLFDPKYFLCKLTPIHITRTSEENRLFSNQGYEDNIVYQEVEKSLKNVGYDVIVFLPSLDEDFSKITCGNAILSENDIGIE